jgi:hypothetical protein
MLDAFLSFGLQITLRCLMASLMETYKKLELLENILLKSGEQLA